jgi:hypothetical protein
MVVGQRKQQTQQLECNARAAVRQKRVAACMLRKYCPWDRLSHHEWQVLHAIQARLAPGAHSSHTPCAHALPRAPTRTLARAPLLAPAVYAIALLTNLRATPTQPPIMLGSLREDLSRME